MWGIKIRLFFYFVKSPISFAWWFRLRRPCEQTVAWIRSERGQAGCLCASAEGSQDPFAKD